nr:DUF3363 domain-containing protein [Aminobacter anthyllidis]
MAGCSSIRKEAHHAADSLERQVSFDGATWIDQPLVADRPEALRNSGFGGEVREAQVRRRQWLIAQGLAHEEQNRSVYRANMLAMLPARAEPCCRDCLVSKPGLENE